MRAFGRIALCLMLSAAMTVQTGCSYLPVHKSRKEIEPPVQISFSWWGSEIRSDYTLKGIEKYEQNYSSIKLRAYSGEAEGYKRNLDTLMRSELEYDVMQIKASWLSEFSPDGEGFYDLYELSDIISMSNFSAEELSAGVRNGRLNAIPISFDPVAFCYDKEIFDSRGLSVPKTWSELMRVGRKLSEENIPLLDASAHTRWILLIAYEEQFSGKAAFGDDEDISAGCFGIDEVIDMMEMENRLIDSGVLSEEEPDMTGFAQGDSAGELIFISEIPYRAMPLEQNGGTVVIGEYPSLPSAKRVGWYIRPAGYYAISKHTEHPEEAARFLDYLLNDSYMISLQGMEKGVPISRSALETLEGQDMLTGLVYDADTAMKRSGRLDIMDERFEDSERYEEFFRLFDMSRAGEITVEEAARIFIEEYPFM